MMESIEWIIEYKGPKQRKYSKYFHGFLDKQLAFEIAKRRKKELPNLGVRIVEQKRKILKVFKVIAEEDYESKSNRSI